MTDLHVTERVIVPFGSGYVQGPASVDITERSIVPFGPDFVRVARPSGVPSGATVGVPATVAYMAPTSVASTLTFGTATVTVNAVATPFSVIGVNQFGVPQVNMYATPTSVSVTVTVGTPSLAEALYPTGVGSVTTIGTHATVAYCSPASATSVTLFGVATAQRKGWLFRPPVSTYQWRMFKEYEGISVLKENGVWSEVAHPDLERTLTAQIYLGGGRDHYVDDATRAELIAEGYTVTEELIP